MDIVETAALVCRWAVAERALFERLGASGDPAMASAARHAGERAQRWDALVPVLHDVSVTPSDVGEIDQETLADEYRAALARCDEVSDAPVARALRLALVDFDPR